VDGDYRLARVKFRLTAPMADFDIPVTVSFTATYRPYNIDAGLTTTYGTVTTSTLDWLMDSGGDRIFQTVDWIEVTPALAGESNGVELVEPLGYCLDQFSTAIDPVLAD
jgi:hypothetical protein